jgi:uncharacterized cofD-like protein
MEEAKKTKIIVIGGGTGTFVTLLGLKKYPVQLTAIVTMMDSGGSSGRLRDELGVLPPGDIRQCLVALAKSSRLLRDMFNYRFEEGGLKGHTFGNIFLSTLAKTTGSMKKAIEEVGKILRIQGKVVPITFAKIDLCVKLENGRVIVGETHIDVVEKKEKRAKIERAFLRPSVSANPDALQAIIEADFILIGPGDLYTSIIPNLLVNGVSQALQKSAAKKIFVLNLMTKYGQTTSYSARDHVRDLEKYIGKGVLDIILVNVKAPRKEALSWYSDFGENPVRDDVRGDTYRVVRASLIKDAVLPQEKADSLKRSIIRHDPEKLAREIIKLTVA